MTELAHIKSNVPSTASARDKLQHYEDVLKTLPFLFEAHVDHVFAPGVYARCINMPKGTTYTSKIHKTKHIAIVCSGRAIVSTGDKVETIQAPCIFVTEPNTKRALYIEEDCVWITIHPTTETDLAKVEEQIIAENYLEEAQ